VSIEVSSPAFELGATIPKKHAGEGQDVSPPLRWSSLPQGTKEIAIICDDQPSNLRRRVPGAATLAARHQDRAACVADDAFGDASHEPALYGA
jgi:hypothetical protein